MGLERRSRALRFCGSMHVISSKSAIMGLKVSIASFIKRGLEKWFVAAIKRLISCLRDE